MGRPILYTCCPMCHSVKACHQPKAKPGRNDIDQNGRYRYASVPLRVAHFLKWRISHGHGRGIGAKSGFETIRVKTFAETLQEIAAGTDKASIEYMRQIYPRAKEIVAMCEEVMGHGRRG